MDIIKNKNGVTFYIENDYLVDIEVPSNVYEIVIPDVYTRIHLKVLQ